MESLQQATDGDGQRRNAQRYQESDVTLRTSGYGRQPKRLVRGSACNRTGVIHGTEGRGTPTIKLFSGEKYPMIKQNTFFFLCCFFVCAFLQRRANAAVSIQWKVQTGGVCCAARSFSLTQRRSIVFPAILQRLLAPFEWFLQKEETIPKNASLRCRKRSIWSTASTEQQPTARHVEPWAPKVGSGSKLMQTFIFPFKAFGRNMWVRSLWQTQSSSPTAEESASPIVTSYDPPVKRLGPVWGATRCLFLNRCATVVLTIASASTEMERKDRTMRRIRNVPLCAQRVKPHGQNLYASGQCKAAHE